MNKPLLLDTYNKVLTTLKKRWSSWCTCLNQGKEVHTEV